MTTILVIQMEVTFTILRRAERKQQTKRNDQAHRGAKPYVGLPLSPMHINCAILLATIKTQTHFPIVLMHCIIECLHGMQSLNPNVYRFKPCYNFDTPNSVQRISIIYIA